MPVAVTSKPDDVADDGFGLSTLGDLKALSTPPKFSTVEEERKHIKERLAAAFRIFAKHDFDHHVAGHLSVRDPGDQHLFWVNPFGLAFALMTVHDLILVNYEGEVVGGGRPGRRAVNRAGFQIHSAIHRARPEVNAVCHAHSIYGKTFSTLGKNIDFTTQDACSFYNDVSVYNDFGGPALGAQEGVNIVKHMGGNRALIMQNHGILTVGHTIESATIWYIMLEAQCKVQLLADAVGETQKITPEDAAYTHSQTGTEQIGYFAAGPVFQVVEAQEGHLYK